MFWLSDRNKIIWIELKFVERPIPNADNRKVFGGIQLNKWNVISHWMAFSHIRITVYIT